MIQSTVVLEHEDSHKSYQNNIEVTNNELQHDTADYWLARYQKNLMAMLAITCNSLPLVAPASELRTEIT